MNTQATTEFRPHVAVINGAIKTTSIVVAEHFGKRHADVLRAVENIDCSPEFIERNFALIEVDTKVGFGIRKDPAYEMTKDGFTFLAMGFTGKEAAVWKEAYINAFNAMAEQLHNLPQLPEPKTKKALPGGLTLEQQDVIKALVNARAEGVADHKKAATIIQGWSAIKKKFEVPKGKTYKAVSPDQFPHIISLLARLPLAGEIMPETPTLDNTITINLSAQNQAAVEKITLQFKAKGFSHGRWTVTLSDGLFTIRTMAQDQFVATENNLPSLLAEPEPVSLKRLPAIIAAAAMRLSAAQRQPIGAPHGPIQL